MSNRILLPLDMGNRNLILDRRRIETNKIKLEEFLLDEPKMHSEEFARSVLLANEVKSNNSVEGYYDDIGKIVEVVEHSRKFKNKSEQDKLRILNLYKGYNYILKSKEINKESLRSLYKILSKGLLSPEDVSNMGKYYRNEPVYIFYSNNPDVPPLNGMDADKLDYFMDKWFSFVNSDFESECLTDEYIKSQIMHFYFVYIHPYFDINGRTSRTASIWHLLNKEAYPYVIFNRGINFNKKEYYDVIMDVRKFANISFFVDYMMKTVLVELQKEHAIQSIAESNGPLNTQEHQTLQYLLSMKGIRTLCDFTNMYNRFNDKKRPGQIYREMIEPLLEQRVLIKGEDTKTKYNNNDHNFRIEFNPAYVDDDPTKTGELKILLPK